MANEGVARTNPYFPVTATGLIHESTPVPRTRRVASLKNTFRTPAVKVMSMDPTIPEAKKVLTLVLYRMSSFSWTSRPHSLHGNHGFNAKRDSGFRSGNKHKTGQIAMKTSDCSMDSLIDEESASSWLSSTFSTGVGSSKLRNKHQPSIGSNRSGDQRKSSINADILSDDERRGSKPSGSNAEEVSDSVINSFEGKISRLKPYRSCSLSFDYGFDDESDASLFNAGDPQKQNNTQGTDAFLICSSSSSMFDEKSTPVLFVTSSGFGEAR